MNGPTTPERDASPVVDKGLAAAFATLTTAAKAGSVRFPRPPSEMPWVDERMEHLAVRKDAP